MKTRVIACSVRCGWLLVVLWMTTIPTAAIGQGLGERLAPSDVQRFEYDVEDVDSGFLPPAPADRRRGGSSEVRVVRVAHQYGLAAHGRR